MVSVSEQENKWNWLIFCSDKLAKGLPQRIFILYK